MSYYTELVLLACVREDKVKAFKEAQAWPENYEAVGLRMFIDLVQLLPEGRSGGALHFRSTGHSFWSDYDVDEDYGTVDALNATWSDTPEIASWLAPFVDEDSRIIFHSLELDGADFAYEFDGNGKYRYLEYRPLSKWSLPAKLNVSPPLKGKKKNRKEKLKEARRIIGLIEKEKSKAAKEEN